MRTLETSSGPVDTNLVHLPSTSAAPQTSDVRHDQALRVRAGDDLAEQLEGTRRAITLGGSLFFIPATAAVVLVGAASLGVTGVWLGICALTGLAIGPGLCLASLAASNLVGRPVVRKMFRARATALGLTDAEIEASWRRADAILNDQARRRLSGKNKRSAS